MACVCFRNGGLPTFQTTMLIDWAVYAAAVWGLAFALNQTLFKDRPPSSFAKWSLTVVLFFTSVVALSIAKFFRYKYISQIMGFNIATETPFDIGGALLGSFLFFQLLGKRNATAEKIGARAMTKQERVQVPAGAEEAIYERIDNELRADNLDRATWTRAQGDADGNAERAKALYIKYRAQRLLAASRDEPSHQATFDARNVVEPTKRYATRFVAATTGILVCAVVAVIMFVFFAEQPAPAKGGLIDIDMTEDDARTWDEFRKSERGKNLDKFNEAGSAAEKAARFGLTLQEYQRRYARSSVLCFTKNGADDHICRADVIAGIRQ